MHAHNDQLITDTRRSIVSRLPHHCSLLLRNGISLAWIAVGLWFSGCGGSMLMDPDAVRAIVARPDEGHRIVFYERAMIFTADGKLLERTHAVSRVGNNAATYRGLVSAMDHPSRRLLEFEARITHAKGTSNTLELENLVSVNMSSSGVFDASEMRAGSFRERLVTGDLIEERSVHEVTHARLGTDFSLAEVAMRADNITCIVEVPARDSVSILLVNDTIAPVVHDSTTRTYTYAWPVFDPDVPRWHPLEKRNRAPRVIAMRAPQTWQSYGDWYLDLVESKMVPSDSLLGMANQITKGLTGAKEKLDAIFEYCQKNIRYEQVYLTDRGIIPEAADSVFRRKYGDCKEYAVVMYAMATAVGVPTQLALCYRGRGVEFFDEMAVSQFNHVLLHYEEQGTHYWYDGTNRVGIPGVATYDLANARALVVERGRSRLVTMSELSENACSVRGVLRPDGDYGLRGTVDVTYAAQYAIDYFWLVHQTPIAELRGALTHALQETLNEDLVIDSLSWQSDTGRFVLRANVKIPNSLTPVAGVVLTSLSRVTPELIPDKVAKADEGRVFYLPSYSTADVDIALEGFSSSDTTTQTLLTGSFRLEAGPFSGDTRASFLARLEQARAAWAAPLKLKRK